ncbi:MAG: glycosyl transferase, group 1 [Bryobacterales bacterium]|nr:glycosyl transferase, group 1 [Bryobacterales bacterium]
MLSYTSAVTIALDATPLTQSAGGIGRYTLELALALASAYPNDQYWLLSDQPFSPPHAPRNLHAGSGPRNPAERKWWLWGLDREMRRRGVELFHGTDYSVPYVPLRPSVMTVHDLSPWLDPSWQPDASRVRRRTPRLLRMGLATMVITPSEAVRHAAIERFRLAPDRVVAVPLAANSSFRPAPAAASGNIPYFLFVGTREPRKNIARLVEAWRKVRSTLLIDLVLVGRARTDFAVLPEEPGLRVLGEIPDSDLPGLYSGALACVYPSLYEGFGLPVLEAMQCGALVITSRDPAILEVSGGGSGGAALHVDAEDTAALAETMQAVAADPGRFAEFRTKALARAAQFSWHETARRTREVYDAAAHIFRHR